MKRKQDEAQRKSEALNVLSLREQRTWRKGWFWGKKVSSGVEVLPFQMDVRRAVQRESLELGKRPGWSTLFFANRMTWETARILNSAPNSPNPKLTVACPHCSDVPAVQLVPCSVPQPGGRPRRHKPENVLYSHSLWVLWENPHVLKWPATFHYYSASKLGC